MASSVSFVCQKYFEGFHDVSTFNANDTCKNLFGILKVISYFTLIIPFIFGVVYGVSSLIGRVSVQDHLSSEDERTASIAQRTLLGVEEQLEQLFRSQSKDQKIFTIDGSKVGVIFNPDGESLRAGFMTVRDKVVFISDKAIPQEVSNRIAAKIPAGCNHSTVCIGSINGQSIFDALGFA